MNIVVVHGQYHKGNTYKVTNMLLEKLNCDGSNIKEFHATNISQCIGCTKCILDDEKLCPNYNQVKDIILAIDSSDVIILESPNYCMNMTGQLKTFCDHMAYRWMSHRPVDMRRKIGVAISTASGAGAGKTTKLIKEQLIWWSVGRVYKISFTIGAFSIDDLEDRRLLKLKSQVAKVSNKINRSINKSKPCLKTRLYFKVMTIMHEKMPWNTVETEYWKKQGWIK